MLAGDGDSVVAVGLVRRSQRRIVEVDGVGLHELGLAELDGARVGVGEVEPDDVVQCLHRRVGRQSGQVGVEVPLELVRQDARRQAAGVDGDRHQRGTLRPQHVHRIVEDRTRGTRRRAGHADARPGERGRRQRLRVVGTGHPAAGGRRRIRRVDAGQHGEQRRRVGDRGGDRPGSVLSGRYRQHPATADQPHRGLDPDHRVGHRRAEDRPGRLGTHGDRRQRRRGRHRRSRAGSARGLAGVVRVEHLAAQAAVPRRHAGGGEVGELGQVRLAQDDRAGRPQPGDQERVPARKRVPQGERARGGRQSGDIDVVFDQHRDAVQRAAHAVVPAFGVEPARLFQGVRGEHPYRVEAWPVRVQQPDPLEVLRHQLPRRDQVAGHGLLQLSDTGALQVNRERPGPRRGGRRRGEQPGQADRGQQDNHGARHAP